MESKTPLTCRCGRSFAEGEGYLSEGRELGAPLVCGVCAGRSLKAILKRHEDEHNSLVTPRQRLSSAWRRA